MAEVQREKRDLVLPPGAYAYMQDLTKGCIKVFAGPCVINQTAQEVPIIYDPEHGIFQQCNSLEDAVRKNPIAVEGYYLILLNPAQDGSQPDPGISGRTSPELNVGRKVNIPGPCHFALWPGQQAQYVRGHHLRSNQYLIIRVYNEDEARDNWSKAVIKRASNDATKPEEKADILLPDDLSVGKQFIIRGTEVSFYIPPTGISVVQDKDNNYVREALTLERLEYCILVDEDGNKDYPRGPAVVFPTPTQAFITDSRGNRKFRAVELNEIQGLHVKVIAAYEEDGRKYNVGEELFITGKETPIYYPREEHSLISYDGKSKHFATAIPAGEARYVMNRMSGEIKTNLGPDMLLPDPRTEVIVRRVLTQKQCDLWYPNNALVKEYNAHLQELLSNVPTTRAGAVSEGDFERGTKGAKLRKFSNNSMMEASAVSSYSSDVAFVADEFSRASNYSEPRTVTLDTKLQGVPIVDIWTGYAVHVVSRTKGRRVEVGPKTILLDYDETLEPMALSTGKPKSTDKLLETVYLRIQNNKVSDVVKVETSDHVMVNLRLSYKIDFTGKPDDPHIKWFDVENYVKYFCDHARSVLKGAVQKITIAEFYSSAIDFVRDILLGKKDDKGERKGFFFTENNMVARDVEILGVDIEDAKIRELLDSVQHMVVRTNIEIAQATRELEVTRTKEGIAQERNNVVALTSKKKIALDIEMVDEQHRLDETKISVSAALEKDKLSILKEQQANTDFTFNADLARKEKAKNQELAVAQQLTELEKSKLAAETTAVIQRLEAAQPGFTEAVLALSQNELAAKIAEATSVQNIIGGSNLSETINNIFSGLPQLLHRVTGNGNGKSEKAMSSRVERPLPG